MFVVSDRQLRNIPLNFQIFQKFFEKLIQVHFDIVTSLQSYFVHVSEDVATIATDCAYVSASAQSIMCDVDKNVNMLK